MDEIGIIVDHDIKMIRRDGLDPDTAAGVRALLLIRAYTRLYALLGGASEDLKHWMRTPNRALGDIPAERMKSPHGLLRLTEYLDAI
ncbi:MAG: MbcA/ParS/Xre antitoxin family protein [Gammaproteobacteria bacterium]